MHRLIVVLCCWLPLGVSAAAVNNLRLWHAPDQTRLVFDLSGPVEHAAFLVGNPERVVVDIVGTTPASVLTLPAQPNGRLQDMRYALHAGNKLRVVFDLKHRVELRSRLLPPQAPYGHRLVIDLLDVAQKETTIAVTPPPAAPVAAPISTTPSAVVATNKLADTKVRIIAIDAGHGGEDVGAIGPRGTYEKTVVLAIARELAALINQEPGMRAVLIREGDYYVGLRERMVRARDKYADLFVSIHADAFHNRRVRGSSVYVLSSRGASSEAARWLAERENTADLVGGVTLDDKDPQLRTVLLDLSQAATLDSSLNAASNVLNGLRRVGAVHRREVQSAGFMVLKSPDIPSLLVETAFISNPTEEQQLKSPVFHRQLAGAIRDGLKSYFKGQADPKQRYAAGRKHLVARGDTLSAIAQRYEVSTHKILLANSRRDETVRLGEILRIP
ncbi:MAG: AMIN domain-containing protein [Gammaproteobacteria bacterium]|nr:AMIN domain-containing protein [Gammaproteobacteria bacterium]